MKLEHGSATVLKESVKKIIGKYLSLDEYEVFFFGSRVRMDNFPRSDIDIGILGPGKVPVDLKLKIQEELDKLPLLYKIEIVDFYQVTDKFKNLALQSRELIN